MNLYDLPYRATTHEKLASAEPDPVIRDLLSGNLEKMASHMSSEDRAFFHLSEDTQMKLAAGETRGYDDVSDTDVAAITVLGGVGSNAIKIASDKVAAYVDFFDEMVTSEIVGRSMGREVYASEKMAEEAAAEAEEGEDEKDEAEKDAAFAFRKVASAVSRQLRKRAGLTR